MDDGIFDTLGNAPSLNLLIRKVNKSRDATRSVCEQVGRLDGLVESIERKFGELSNHTLGADAENLLRSMTEEISDLKSMANSAHEKTVDVRNILDNVIDYGWLRAQSLR